MKFGKRLRQQIKETLPDWRDKYLSYKELKKHVRLISSTGSLHFTQAQAQTRFVYLLNNEIHKFNVFFLEQEEDFIIRNKELQDRMEEVNEKWGPNGSEPMEAKYKEEMGKIRKDIVNFHGEMVLLENYSNINYTGLGKILKKYEKRTGGILRVAFIKKVIQEPFFATDLISKLVKECENTVDAVFPVEFDRKSREIMKLKEEAEEEGIMRKTVAALVTMQEMRRSSSTYSHFSLPPLTFPDSSDLIQSLQSLNPPIPIL